ncbi:O-antigen ligase family protein [Methylobacterium sp. J-068]|uniref:O-antigen ligase family protein n=1 Tax=Methylobacterium sp. J-068 TaxID=2836649 RepID=UPI001FBBBB36|nr:O-antigen ligase family protein [Methylobacterium sp. J-068]MCJ2035713.1 O-antigen ligase family protein [Methylobacterium sp. J-068]
MTMGLASDSGAAARGDLPDAVRVATMGAILLFVLIGADPFLDGTAAENAASRAGGNLVNQVLFLILGAASVAVLAWRGREALRPLATLPILAMLGWICVSTALSIEPAVSARRLISLFIMFGGVVSVLVLARDARQFADVLGGSVLLVLVLCYLGLVLVPERAMHTALDLIEPEHAGSWRGVYAHKNGAGAAMGLYVIVGLFWAAMGRRVPGTLVVVLAAVFLVFTNAKTSLAMTPAVLGLSWACTLSGSRNWRRLVLLGPLALLLVATVGSVMVPAIGAAVASLTSDPTYTGRTEIWTFALENIAKKPITGFGYGAFWESVFYGGGADATTWVNRATDAHDGYLNTALENGLPGLAFTVWWLVLAPLSDLQARRRERGQLDPLAMLFLRIWLFGLMVAVFESVFYQATNTLFFLLCVAVLGLRFSAGARLIEAAPR